MHRKHLSLESCSFPTNRSTSRTQTATKFVISRYYFNSTNPQIWITNESTKRDYRKLWNPALCCEDLMSCIINGLRLYQPCAAKTYTSSKSYRTTSWTSNRILTLVRFNHSQKTTFAKVCGITKKTHPVNHSRPSHRN